MSEWQPIETAPHVNGVQLLFMAQETHEYTVGRWDGDGWDMQCAPPQSPFTYWMPLPAPPTEPEPAGAA